MFDIQSERRKLTALETLISSTELRVMDQFCLIRDLRSRQLDTDKEEQLLYVMVRSVELMQQHYQSRLNYVLLMERLTQVQ